MYYEMKCTAFVVIDTKASEKLTSLLNNTYLLKDLTRLSPSYQTSSLESFHSVVIHYAPKSIAFSYTGMQSRCVYCYFKHHNAVYEYIYLLCIIGCNLLLYTLMRTLTVNNL